MSARAASQKRTWKRNITVTVDVENTGDVAGKTVVQLYSSPEYFEGEIEKAAVNLVGYTKTDIIEPGATETVTVTINAKILRPSTTTMPTATITPVTRSMRATSCSRSWTTRTTCSSKAR